MNLFVRPPWKDDGLASEARVAHPNEEYFMRISGILKDAEEIATSVAKFFLLNIR